jgi:hypothetical protein
VTVERRSVPGAFGSGKESPKDLPMSRRAAAVLALAFVAAPALLAAPALAQERPSSTRMTCRQAAGLIQARGALVLGTGGQTYDRYVRDRSFCEPTEVTQRRFVPTLDNPQCFVGYRCREPSYDDWAGDDF